jgi:hypothetical protein
MSIPSAHPSDIQAIAILAVLIGSLCVIYWRVALRLVAIALIALAIFGVVLVIYGLHHSVR